MYTFLKTFIDPYLVLVVLATWTARSARRRNPSFSTRMAYRACFLLWLLSLPISGWLAQWTLEQSHRPTGGQEPIPEAADAVIVLGGGMYVFDDPDDVAPSVDSVERCLHAVRIGEPSQVTYILCGTRPQLAPDAPSEAEAMRRFLVQLGIPDQRILLEESSASTYENAVNATQIVRDHGFQQVYVVTQGWHLHRALLCFRKQGLDVTGSGSSWMSYRIRLHWYRHALPSLGAIKTQTQMLREWVGLAWYRFKERI